MLTLPEHLLLIALHDDKGTVHPAAFLALDTCLRAAVLAELRLQGRVQTSTSGEVRRVDARWQPTGFPVEDAAMEVLADCPSPGPLETWMKALEEPLEDVRAAEVALLERRGILERTDVGHGLLGDSVVHPMRNETAEYAMRDRMKAVVHGEARDTPPRVGTLIALADVCNLLGAAFELDDRGEALNRAQWVEERDAIVRAAREAVGRAEGTWS